MKKFVLLFVILGITLTKAQDTGEDKLGAWYMYFGMNKISEDWSIHSEAQFRFYEIDDSFNQLLLRTGLNYHINERAIATGGYAFIATDPTFEGDENLINKITEHRIFQQFILLNSVGKVTFEHRYRLEQRFITVDDVVDDSFTEHRTRYRLQVTVPLTKLFFLNFYDEVFINLQNNIFDQNRLYGALGIRLSKASSLQLGYLKNHFNTINFDRLQFGVFINPDLSKKKSK
ncbi:MAG: DUF2490 domain-containing protein [Bacteroidota bacterium]